MRKTKIVCTLGPATDSEEKIKELMLAGMDVARFNFSHGTHEEHLARYQMVCKCREELRLPVGTMLDTKGPEIRSLSSVPKRFWVTPIALPSPIRSFIKTFPPAPVSCWMTV